MGLLDNLFKPKPESGAEKSVENTSGEGAAESASLPKLSPFLAPKIYVPRSSVQIVPPTKPQPQGDRKLAPVAEPSAAPKEIVLTLGDVLSRIPAHFLREGEPDLRRELRFPAEGLAADIARGRASVYLADIVAQCPDFFLPVVAGFDDIQIRLPLQKLVEQIALGAGNPPPVSTPAPEPPVAEKSAIPVPAAVDGEAQIHLSLAAIMRRCPREIIVQPLPPIEESVHVTFPFAPIERQLSTGQVEVSSLRFIAALPLGLMKCFEAKAGVKVPLPLEDIFQNLPNQKPPAGVEMRLPTPSAPPAETDRARENAKLAESILLEPMFETVEITEPPTPAPPVAENVVITANFTPAPEIREPVFTAPPEPEKTDAAVELEAQLEALAREDAKIDSRLAEESLLAPLPTSPVEETLPPVSEITPAPAPPATEAPVNIPVPSVGQYEFRPCAPTLRRPVILRSTPEPEELRPTPLPSEPAMEPSPAVESILPPPATEPPAAIASEPEPVPQETSPIAAASDPVPEIAEPVARTLRIAPPQFRPFVVHVPPIVFAPADATTPTPPAEPPAPAPVVAKSVVEQPPSSPEPQPESVVEPFIEKEAAPSPVSPISELAKPLLLDGRVREFFASDAPLPLPRVSQLLAALPGINGCVLIARSMESHSGELPSGLDPSAVRDLSQRMRGALSDRAEMFGSSEMQHLTLHTEQYSLSLFTRGEACACAIHRARIFLPGVRETFSAVADELARISH